MADGDIEAWVLTFGWPIEVDEEAKLVWRVTGDGQPAFAAVGPSGRSLPPVWGPDAHGGSNWQRPGDEWGTGWILDEPGCWRIEVQRGGATAAFEFDVI